MSNDDAATELWRKRRNLDNERRAFMQEAMKDYDEEVYYPGIDAIKEECERTIGHRPGAWHDNGWGRNWRECTICHKTVEEEYYEI